MLERAAAFIWEHARLLERAVFEYQFQHGSPTRILKTLRAYQNDDGMWYALLNGRWVPVPPRVVLKQLAPDGRSHICASKSGMIYCFLGGSPKI